MNDMLTRICTARRRDVQAARRARPPDRLEADARQAGPVRGFATRLRQQAGKGYGIIAEIKKASPSRGLIRPDLDPPGLARAFERGGAACLSVLTEPRWFQGSPADLQAARAASRLPVLRKDFMLDPYQIVESRAIGADCILLILAALSDPQARELADTARDQGLDILVEVHNRAELDRAIALDAPMIGINNRNLGTLAVDLATSEALAPHLPPDRTGVCESGLTGKADLDRMSRAGLRCFLIGESLMRQADVGAALGRLTGVAA